MKDSRKQAGHQSKPENVSMPRPENKDNLDSRKEKEPGYKDHNNKQGRKPNTKDKNDAGN